MSNSQLEKDILERVDRLIEEVIELGRAGEGSFQENKRRCLETVAELGGLLTVILEGKGEEHLKPLLKQLVAQRIPDKSVLASFGSFSSYLETAIEEGVELYLGSLRGKTEPQATSSVENPEGVPAESETLLPEESGKEMPRELEASLEALKVALVQAYPGEEIVAGYPTRVGKISFYLPRLRLGFELESPLKDWRQEFYCRQEGIRLRRVKAEELANPTYLARKLKREG